MKGMIAGVLMSLLLLGIGCNSAGVDFIADKAATQFGSGPNTDLVVERVPYLIWEFNLLG